MEALIWTIGIIVAIMGLAVWVFSSRKTTGDLAANVKKTEFHDWLDDSVLTDPVDLKIVHPKKGAMTVKVNSWNKELYEAHPRFFSGKKKSRNSSCRYLVRGGGYGGGYGGGFDLIDAWVFYMLFVEPFFDTPHGYEDYDPSIFEGGESGGAGAGGSWADDVAGSEVAMGGEAAEDAPASADENAPLIEDVFGREVVNEGGSEPDHEPPAEDTRDSGSSDFGSTDY